MMERKSDFIIVGSVPTALLSTLLFWLPILGLLIADRASGVRSRNVMSGIIAIVFPCRFDTRTDHTYWFAVD